MVTKTFKTYEASAYKTVSTIQGGEVVAGVEHIATIQYVGKGSQGYARKVFSAEGYYIPKGSSIVITPISKATYACTDEEFLSIAHLSSTQDPDE